MKKQETKETDQFNLFSTPVSTIERFNKFYNNYRQVYNRKATRSNVGAIILDLGLTICEQELERKREELEIKE
jgi:hypothetical protein